METYSPDKGRSDQDGSAVVCNQNNHAAFHRRGGDKRRTILKLRPYFLLQPVLRGVGEDLLCDENLIGDL